MDIENEILKKAKIDLKKLEEYGFVKDGEVYKYSKKIMDNFRVDIVVDENRNLIGKIFDLMVDEEYINYRIESQVGKFVSSIREEYVSILKDILDNCTNKVYFLTEQANRITKLVCDLYQDEPEFAWEKFPGYGIFKNHENDKWYGLVMNIDKSKLDKKSSGEIEIINVKLDEEKINNLLTRKGFYPSYHMNKKNWISIILDDTIRDEEILEYIKESHEFTESSNEWIIPANPKFYDVINCFNDTDTIIWKQSNAIKVGDMIYLYVGAPYSAILYKCEAIEVNIPYTYKDDNLSIKQAMKIKLLKKFDQNEFTFARLNEYGVTSIRGPRSLPKKLSNEINK